MMYAAFWIDPKATDSDKRIVVCRPFVSKPNTAWAVLRSALHEDRTGGIIAGPQENLFSCVEAIDSQDQEWPSDGDRMVAAITKLATQLECTVVFRQNLRPDGSQQHASIWQDLLQATPKVEDEETCGATITTALVGSPEVIDAGIAQAVNLGWSTAGSDASCTWASKMFDGIVLTLRRYASSPTRAVLEAYYPPNVTAESSTKTNETGFSQELPKFGFDRLDELLDRTLGPTNKRYKFLLLVKEKNGSVVFFGTKKVQNLRQAIAAYVAHLQDRSSDEEESRQSSRPGEHEPDLLDDMVAPPVGNCRFWKL